MKFYLGLVLINLCYCALALKNDRVPTAVHTQNPIGKDVPLNVMVTEIGESIATFNISGSDTVDGKPVVSLNVKYTVDDVTDKANTQTKSFSNANGALSELVEIKDLEPGRHYTFQFSGVNAQKEEGPPSKNVSVLLLPPAPDISIEHHNINQLKVMWGENRSKSEDYFLLTVEKQTALGCGLTLNITSCFGNKYTLDDLEVGQVYKLTMRAHNPTGFSEPVVVHYPIDN